MYSFINFHLYLYIQLTTIQLNASSYTILPKLLYTRYLIIIKNYNLIVTVQKWLCGKARIYFISFAEKRLLLIIAFGRTDSLDEASYMATF